MLNIVLAHVSQGIPVKEQGATQIDAPSPAFSRTLRVIEIGTVGVNAYKMQVVCKQGSSRATGNHIIGVVANCWSILFNVKFNLVNTRSVGLKKKPGCLARSSK